MATYREIVELLKMNVSTDLQTAIAQGEITVDEEEVPRLIQLLQSLIEVYAANGHELLERVV